ncbi:2OG-Fe(II) oxygenase [Nocardioides sp. LML1-1-1.1]|uniref:2OG-Fe(II) oxygenase n=1 Tax=Nocardioides sp. LML1-1-1.1 TaxID=3135248 RepID=UPI0034265F75
MREFPHHPCVTDGTEASVVAAVDLDLVYDSGGGPRVDPHPFPHFIWDAVYRPEVAQSILSWLQAFPGWEGREQPHWKASAFALKPTDVPTSLQPVFSATSLRFLRTRMEEAYSRPFDNAIKVEAYRHGRGDQTTIHTDYEPGKTVFTHRLITYFADPSDEVGGGDLRLFEEGSSGPVEARRYAATHNLASSLEFGPSSFHQVAAVTRGLRYSLVWSFTANAPA